MPYGRTGSHSDDQSATESRGEEGREVRKPALGAALVRVVALEFPIRPEGEHVPVVADGGHAAVDVLVDHDE